LSCKEINFSSHEIIEIFHLAHENNPIHYDNDLYNDMQIKYISIYSEIQTSLKYSQYSSHNKMLHKCMQNNVFIILRSVELITRIVLKFCKNQKWLHYNGDNNHE
jgi:hypothetical protein